MRCPKCGGYRFDSDDKCLNCGYLSLKTEIPRSWRAGDSNHSNNITDSKERKNLSYCFKHKKYYNPAYGCETCRLEKLAIRWNAEESTKLYICPKCKRESLFWNYSNKMYECLNNKCKKAYTQFEFNPKSQEEATQEQPTESIKQVAEGLKICSQCGKGMLRWNWTTLQYECLNNKCQAILSDSEYMQLVSSQSSKGNILLRKIQKVIWALVSAIGSRTKNAIRRNISKSIRKTKNNVRDFRRSGWLLVLIGLAIIFISIGYYPSIVGESRFAQWMETPVEVFGGLLILVGFFMGTHRSRMKVVRTLLVFLMLFTGCSYAYQYLDESGKIDEWLGRTTEEGTIGGEIAEGIPSLVDTIRGVKLETPEPTPVPPQLKPTPIPPSTNESRVWVGNAYIVGADGNPIIIVNNNNAENPSWNQLTSFLKQDSTDEQMYNYNSFVCADFAEMLHNNAEKAGWRAAYVSIELGSSRLTSSGGHALNAFETTDRGLVYIDCTAPLTPSVSADKVVDVKVGRDYIPTSIFPEPGWQSTWENMGRVTEIEAVQW